MRKSVNLDLLTERQKKIYIFIKDKIQTRGYGPTVREIGLEFEIASPNGVMCHLKALQKKGLIHREPNMSRAIELLDTNGRTATGLRIMGTIAAGPPIEAVEEAELMSFDDWQYSGETFGLRVKGDSMIEAHIADGDVVILKRQKTANNGQIVAVIDDIGEATLKKFYRDKNKFRLEPCNKDLLPIIRDSVEIMGILVGVVRRV
ncbi:MAG: transcriptional repressor LexA [Planctomycetota bacterium]|jgi:repressor LexA|nr:transcriptional repressor LexA [Planctomycetota bacterium]